jgi:hypothetical protein
MGLQKPQGAGASSAARTLAVGLQQMRWAMKALLTASAIKKTMSNIVFDMAAATLSNDNLRGVSSNAPANR